MSSTHHSIALHFVFSTKGRVPSIAAAWRGRLHAFLGGSLRENGAEPLAVGGVADHLHLLAGMPATISAAELMQKVKSISCGWVHGTIGERGFEWQEGYGVFSVSPPDVDAVRRYIANQEAHHATKSFVGEYREMLKRAGVEYDPRYV